MKCTSNVGKTDKIIRILIGVAIGVTGIIYHNWLGLIGIVPVATALVNWCPLYVPFKLTTKKE